MTAPILGGPYDGDTFPIPPGPHPCCVCRYWRLEHRPEYVAVYSWAPMRGVWVFIDWQRIDALERLYRLKEQARGR